VSKLFRVVHKPGWNWAKSEPIHDAGAPSTVSARCPFGFETGRDGARRSNRVTSAATVLKEPPVTASNFVNKKNNFYLFKH